MRYAVVKPQEESIAIVEEPTIDGATTKAELDPLRVDHGTVQQGLGIMVYEFGLLEPCEHYFAIHGQLFAGNAVLYAYDEHGETVPVPMFTLALPFKFLHGIAAVEAAITRGEVTRPYAAVNGEKLAIWSDGELRSCVDENR